MVFFLKCTCSTNWPWIYNGAKSPSSRLYSQQQVALSGLHFLTSSNTLAASSMSCLAQQKHTKSKASHWLLLSGYADPAKHWGGWALPGAMSQCWQFHLSGGGGLVPLRWGCSMSSVMVWAPKVPPISVHRHTHHPTHVYACTNHQCTYALGINIMQTCLCSSNTQLTSQSCYCDTYKKLATYIVVLYQL